MNIITSDTLLDYPREACPHCDEKTLYLEFDEWYEHGTPTEIGVHVHCKNETNKHHDRHDYMPYVYWLPLERRAYRWCLDHVRIVDNDDRERLADWNEGKPLKGGMR